MGVMQKYICVFESETPPQIMLGQMIGGAQVKELKIVNNGLLSASTLAEKYNISTQTVHRKLKDFNQGTSGKYLYDAKIADEILNSQTKRGTGGARRKA